MPSSLLFFNHACSSNLHGPNNYFALINAFISSSNSLHPPRRAKHNSFDHFYSKTNQQQLSPSHALHSRHLSTTSSVHSLEENSTKHRHPSQHARRDTHPFPFPSHTNPSPYEIFHLPVGATQSAIKGRYYDLVRLHHPDSPHCRSLNLTPSVARSRFHAITAAYDALRRGTASTMSRPSPSSNFRHRPRSDMYGYSGHSHTYGHARGFNAEWAGMGGSASAGSGSQEPGEDRWKERVIIGMGLGAIAIALSPVFSFAVVPNTLSIHEGHNRTAAHNLAAARREARYVRWAKEGKSGYETDSEESDLESTDA